MRIRALSVDILILAECALSECSCSVIGALQNDDDDDQYSRAALRIDCA